MKKIYQSIICLLLLSNSLSAQVEGPYGLICIPICPGETYEADNLQSIDENNELAEAYGWKRAGCYYIDIPSSELSFSFDSENQTEDVDWLLFVEGIGLTPIEEAHEGPVLGHDYSPYVPSTSSSANQSEVNLSDAKQRNFIVWTKWGQKKEVDQSWLYITDVSSFDCESKFEVFPNITGDCFTVLADETDVGEFVTLLNSNGIVIRQERLLQAKTNICASDISSGQYFVVINNVSLPVTFK